MALLRVIPKGDLALVAGNVVWIEGLAMRRQQIAARFQFFLGEWFLDRAKGVPYMRDVFVANPQVDVIRSVFRSVLLLSPGVLSTPQFALLVDRAARRCAFDFVAICDAGRLTVTALDTAFHILY